MEKKTPLYQDHVDCGGKMVPFAGYLLPVQYKTGVINEHMAVRQKCGLFDVSHMGEFTLIGSDSINNLNHILTNDYTQMYDGQARYSPMCNEDGGVVDDLIVYKIYDEHYLIVVNAANIDKDFAWISQHISGDVKLENISDSVSQIALQGPMAQDILEKLVSKEMLPSKYYSANFHAVINNIPCCISRTGYTGESGFEIYLAPDQASVMWNLLLDAGKDQGLIPCGLGARDTLRLEAGMPLYGHEMDDKISPIEAGLKHFVKMNKSEFIGKQALIDRGEPTHVRVGLQVCSRGIIREHQDVYIDDKKVGMTTSGTHCPYFKCSLAMAMIDCQYKELDTLVKVDVRGRMIEAKIVKLPFYKKAKK